MKDLKVWPVRWAGLVTAALVACLMSSCEMFRSNRDCDGTGCPHPAKVCEKPTVRALAGDLDELEKHVERFGSVVASQPSVWGQARLTKHREDFELQMS